VALAVVFVAVFFIVKNVDEGSSSESRSDLSPLGGASPSNAPTLAPTFPKLSYDILPLGDISTAENIFADAIAEESVNDEVDGVLYYEITGDRTALINVYESDCKTKVNDQLIRTKPIYGPITESGLHIYFAIFFFVDFSVMPYTTFWNPEDKTFKICSRIDMTYNGPDGPGDLDGDGIAGGLGDSVAFHKTISTWTIYLDGGINTEASLGVNAGGIEAVVERET